MHLCIYKHNPIYNLLSLYNVPCMYVFRADCLALDKQLVSSSLGKTIPPTLSMSYLPLVLCVWLKPGGLLPINLDMSITVLI